jgi:predicted DNA-binding WGR domain protein
MTETDSFPADTDLTSIDPARNRWRFYRVVLQQDLLGGTAVIREWGRLGQPGRIRRDPYPDTAAAETAAAELVRRKEKRGYVPVR